MKIAREEQKLIKAQRQLESIRLLDELFDRIKVNDKKYATIFLKLNKTKLVCEYCNIFHNFYHRRKWRKRRLSWIKTRKRRVKRKMIK